MTTAQLRQEFAAVFARCVIHEPETFYAAFDEGETGMIDYLTALWEQLCEEKGVLFSEHPFFPATDFWLVDETEENFTCLMVASLPPLAQTADAALLSVVFGATMNVRCFTGTRQGIDIALCEWLEDGDTVKPKEWETFPETKNLRQEMAQHVYAVCDRYQPN